MKNSFFLSCVAIVCFTFATIASAEPTAWQRTDDVYTLSDRERELACTLRHPRNQQHLYLITLVQLEGDRHHTYVALVLYRIETFTVIEGVTAYQLIRRMCGLPEQYAHWFP